jgi:hypothetical protein
MQDARQWMPCRMPCRICHEGMLGGSVRGMERMTVPGGPVCRIRAACLQPTLRPKSCALVAI